MPDSEPDDDNEPDSVNESALRDELDAKLLNAFIPNPSYDSARSALVYWQDDDLKVLEEVEAFAQFLYTTFGYDSNLISIPSEQAQATLAAELSNFVYRHGASRRSLLIVFYAGHGDEGGSDKKATWAAKNRHGPTLNWYEVQPILHNAIGDVLVILDCCYALQAARGRENRIIELLAASGVHGKTPPPGDYSFTTIMMRVMKRMLEDAQEIKVYDLWRRLIQKTAKDEEVYADPHHFYLAEGEGSIILRPLMKHQDSRNDLSIMTPALVSLTISLSQRPDRLAMKRLGNWLKSAAPKFVSRISVDEILLRAEGIQTFLQHSQFNRLRASVFKDLFERKLPDTVAISPQPESCSATALENEARNLVERLLGWNEHVYQSMQSNLFLHPSFSSMLSNLLTDDDAKAINLSEAARLRLLELGSNAEVASVDIRPLAAGSVKFVDPGDFASDKLSILCHGSYGRAPVVIERRSVSSGHDDSNSAKMRTRKQIQHLSKLLSLAKDPYFHLAPFLGYLDEPHNDLLGLVFRFPGPQGSDTYDSPDWTRYAPRTLHLEISATKWLSLTRRVDLAIALVRSMFAFHAVGWLHHKFSSNTVVFFPFVQQQGSDANMTTSAASEHVGQSDNATPSTGSDLSRPFIFGFEHSRHEDMTSHEAREFWYEQLPYTHPARWGRPSQKFSMEHDIYALGVVLLEIGCWRTAQKMDRTGRGFRYCRHETQVRDALLEVAREQLGHMAGEAYSRATIACLDGSLARDADAEGNEEVRTETLEGNESGKKITYSRSLRSLRLHKAFGKAVLDVIIAVRKGL